MSKSSREHELFQELRAARRDRAAALEDEEEARRVAAEKKAVRRKFDLLIEEILDEIETGKRRDSLIEYAESRAEAAEAEDTADERQRGPTAPPPPPAKASARKPERADRRTALGEPEKVVAEDWAELWKAPWSHGTIVPLRSGPIEVASKYRPIRGKDVTGELEFGPPMDSCGYGSYGVSVPDSWSGSPWEYVDRLVHHILRLTGKDVLRPVDEPAWRYAPLSAMSKLTNTARAILERCGVKTVGDLVDARELGADDCRTSPDDGYTKLLPDGAPWQGVLRALDEYLDEVPGRRGAEASTADDGWQLPDDVPAGKAEWGQAGRLTVALKLPTGADYVQAKYTPRRGTFGSDHLEFKGPVSKTSFRSHYFDRPEAWDGDLDSYASRLARHLCRVLAGLDAAEAKDAPAWRSIGLGDPGSPIDLKLAKDLKRGGLRTLGDLADMADLECYACTTLNGQTVVSQAKFDAAAKAIDGYRDQLARAAAKVQGDPSEFAEAFDPCELHEGSWRDTKLRDVIRSKDVLAELHRYDTLGNLADAAGSDGALYAELDLDLTQSEMLNVERDLSAWVRKYPKGFPAELIEDLRIGLDLLAPPPADAEAPRADEYFDAALASACWPEGSKPEWSKHRKFGSISDREVHQVLKSIWPARHVHTPDEGSPGWTTYGGEFPAFWVGDQSGKGPKPPGLHGVELADAVRRVLRIPSPSGAPRLPGAPAEPPAPAADGKAKKPRKSKAAAAAE